MSVAVFLYSWEDLTHHQVHVWQLRQHLPGNDVYDSESEWCTDVKTVIKDLVLDAEILSFATDFSYLPYNLKLQETAIKNIW